MNKQILQYVWLDGLSPENLRSKIKVVDPCDNIIDLLWSFDGSSTNQSSGGNSDCQLKPVRIYKTPSHDAFVSNFIVLCEVMNMDGTPHTSNTRHKMVKTNNKYKEQKMWFGLEQEYTLYDENGIRPYKWGNYFFPSPQGRYYCGVGSDVAWGRRISDEHLLACLDSNILIEGTNAEVMPSQWEYQIGYGESEKIADDIWASRFILNIIAEYYGVSISLEPKPVKGDWNGAGCHVNFSNIYMREKLDSSTIDYISNELKLAHKNHMLVYGINNSDRLTGKHETCHFDDFRIGHSDRGASIRIPPIVREEGKGYLEDRRPAANIDPYVVCEKLLDTIGKSFEKILDRKLTV